MNTSTDNAHEAGKVSDAKLDLLIDIANPLTGWMRYLIVDDEVLRALVSALTELRTRRAESQTGAVRVKGLEWNPFEAFTFFGRYTVADHPGSDGKFGASRDGRVIGRFGSVPEAKAACEADFTGGVLSALEPTPIKETATLDTQAGEGIECTFDDGEYDIRWPGDRHLHAFKSGKITVVDTAKDIVRSYTIDELCASPIKEAASAGGEYGEFTPVIVGTSTVEHINGPQFTVVSPAVPAAVQWVTDEMVDAALAAQPHNSPVSYFLNPQGYLKTAGVRELMRAALDAAFSLSDYQRLAAENERLTKMFNRYLVDLSSRLGGLSRYLNEQGDYRDLDDWSAFLLERTDHLRLESFEHRLRADVAESKLAEAVKVLERIANDIVQTGFGPKSTRGAVRTQEFLASLTSPPTEQGEQ